MDQNVTYYRLKQLDKSGNYQYSFIISIHNKLNSTIEIYPNPATSTIKLMSPTLISNLVIFDSFGKKVKEMNAGEIARSTGIDISSLAAGQYFISVTSSNRKTVQSFLKR